MSAYVEKTCRKTKRPKGTVQRGQERDAAETGSAMRPPPALAGFTQVFTKLFKRQSLGCCPSARSFPFCGFNAKPMCFPKKLDSRDPTQQHSRSSRGCESQEISEATFDSSPGLAQRVDQELLELASLAEWVVFAVLFMRAARGQVMGK